MKQQELEKSKEYKYGFVTDIESIRAPKGLNEEVIKFISKIKKEPKWMLEWRLKAFNRLKNVKEPNWQKPKYPKIEPAVEINPNHPNLTIWHNKIDACMFVGVHCHQANLSLKIIRGGTYCYTIAMCAQAGHEDAMLSFRDATADKIMKLADWVKKLKGSVEPPSKDHPFQ